MALITTVILPPGLAAARPAAGQAGRLYYSTDTTNLDYDNGAAWVAYAGAGAAIHDLLSATHGDTDPQVVTQGSMIVADSTPEWTELVAGIGHAILKMNAGGTDPAWVAFDWDNIGAAAGADMAHDHSAAGEGGEVPLASLGDYTQGDLMIGGAADWEDLAIGAPAEVLTVNVGGTEPEWAAAGGGGRTGDDYYGPNLIKNSPGQIAVDGAEPQWWDDVANATITDEDTAGEVPPDIHERCFKVVTIANDVYGYQTFTLADEEVLDAGVTIVSLGCWVYCATGAKASIGIFGTNLTLQESAQAGGGAWEWLEVNNITLNAADATIQVRLIVDTDTAWFTMPMFAVGPVAQPWIPRGTKYIPRIHTSVFDTTSGDVAYSDIDLTVHTDDNAVLIQTFLQALEPNGTTNSTFTAGHHDDVVGGDTQTVYLGIQATNSSWQTSTGLVRCNDSQVIRWRKQEVDNDGDFRTIMFVTAWYEWE